MNRLFKFTIISLLAIGMTGCHGDLEPLEYGTLNPSIFPKNYADFEALMFGCYDPLRADYGRGIYSPSERGIYTVEQCMTGEIWGRYGYWQLNTRGTFNTQASDSYALNRYYTYFVGKVSHMTEVLDMMENTDALTDDEKKILMAEVRLARAYLAYLLFDFYGPIQLPSLEEIKKPLEIIPVRRATNAEMVELIESDLLFAADYLPHPHKGKTVGNITLESAGYGRFSEGLAKMLLIRLYLHQTPSHLTGSANWPKVENLCRDLMGSNYDYALHPSYPEMFDPATTGPSIKEYIFTIPCENGSANLNQWQMAVSPSEWDHPAGVTGYSSFGTTWLLYDHYHAEDTRTTYMITEYHTKDGNTRNRETPVGGPNIMREGPLALKTPIWTSPSERGHDMPIFRYADVLLTLAEAIYMQRGVTQEALDLVNSVLTRSQVPDSELWTMGSYGKTVPVTETKSAAAYLEPVVNTDFLDAVLKERWKEFWCENGQQRADLIRHNKLTERLEYVLRGNNTTEENITNWRNDYWLLSDGNVRIHVYPLPRSVVMQGEGLALQNPGYNQ